MNPNLFLKSSLLYDWFGKRSFAQAGEDVVAAALFEKGAKGFYVDVGAFHPKQLSNTYFFYKKGWRGVLIEPNKNMAESLERVRRGDVVVQEGVGEKVDILDYFVFNEPACNTFSRETAEEYKKVGRKMERVEKIKVEPLWKILEVVVPKKQKIDLLSVDVEGVNLEVLKTMDWEKWKPAVVIAEDMSLNHEKPMESEVVKYVKKQGYRLVSVLPYSLIFKVEDER